MYRLAPGESALEAAPAAGTFAAELWRPTAADPTPPAMSAPVGAVWAAFHLLRVFTNRDYAQLLLRDGGRVVHRSGVYPRWARFPFMATADLQIGDTWTDPAYRGQGLATRAITEVVSRLAVPGRAFWYVTERDNLPSVRAAERAGFALAGVADRTAPFNVRALGAFVLRP